MCEILVVVLAVLLVGWAATMVYSVAEELLKNSIGTCVKVICIMVAI